MKAKVILLTILLTCAVSVQGRDCPDKILFEPCRCNLTDILSVTCSDIHSIAQLQKVVDNTLDYPFEKFRIESSNFVYVNITWLAQKRTKILQLKGMTMVDLFDNTSTLPLVKELTIDSLLIQRGWRWSQFKPFVNLWTLIVNGSGFKKLGKDFRENVNPKLDRLILYRSKYLELEEGDFEGKNKLTNIYITESKIKILKNSYFRDQKASLKWLDLSSNPIESLPEDLLEGFQALQGIILLGCKIRTFSAGLFEHAERSLQTFDVQRNPVVCDCKMKWITTGKRSINVRGSCRSPPSLYAKFLSDLTEEDFPLCGRRNTLPFDH